MKKLSELSGFGPPCNTERICIQRRRQAKSNARVCFSGMLGSLTIGQRGLAFAFSCCFLTRVALFVLKHVRSAFRASAGGETASAPKPVQTVDGLDAESGDPSTPQAVVREIALPSASEAIEVLSKWGSIVGVICFLCFCLEAETIFPVSHCKRVYSRDFFIFLCIIWLAVGFLTVKRTDPVVLGRPQTGEWRGWMQFAFLLYHYEAARETFPFIRLFVSAYVWMTGFGNFSFFYTRGDFSFARFARMFWRLNFSVFFLCLTMDNPYFLYYIVPLHTSFFCLVFFSMRVARAYNYHRDGVRLRLLLVGGAVFLLFCLPGVFKFVFAVFGVPVLPHSRWSLHQLFYRAYVDCFSSTFGMITAAFYPMFRQFCSQTGRANWRRRWGARSLLIVVSVLVILMWLIFMVPLDPVTYSAFHPFVVPLLICAIVYLRNFSKTARSYYVRVFEVIGTITLETYLLQFHLFLGGSATTILVLVPSYPFVNLILLVLLFIPSSWLLYHATLQLRDVVLPRDSFVALRNIGILSVFGGFAAVAAAATKGLVGGDILILGALPFFVAAFCSAVYFGGFRGVFGRVSSPFSTKARFGRLLHWAFGAMGFWMYFAIVGVSGAYNTRYADAYGKEVFGNVGSVWTPFCGLAVLVFLFLCVYFGEFLGGCLSCCLFVARLPKLDWSTAFRDLHRSLEPGVVLLEYLGVPGEIPGIWGIAELCIGFLSSLRRRWRILLGLLVIAFAWLTLAFAAICLSQVWRRSTASDSFIVPEWNSYFPECFDETFSRHREELISPQHTSLRLPRTFVAGELNSVRFAAHDERGRLLHKGGDVFFAQFWGASIVVPWIEDLGNGMYDLNFVIYDEGKYDFSIVLQWANCSGTAFCSCRTENQTTLRVPLDGTPVYDILVTRADSAVEFPRRTSSSQPGRWVRGSCDDERISAELPAICAAGDSELFDAGGYFWLPFDGSCYLPLRLSLLRLRGRWIHIIGDSLSYWSFRHLVFVLGDNPFQRAGNRNSTSPYTPSSCPSAMLDDSPRIQIDAFDDRLHHLGPTDANPRFSRVVVVFLPDYDVYLSYMWIPTNFDFALRFQEVLSFVRGRIPVQDNPDAIVFNDGLHQVGCRGTNQLFNCKDLPAYYDFIRKEFASIRNLFEGHFVWRNTARTHFLDGYQEHACRTFPRIEYMNRLAQHVADVEYSDIALFDMWSQTAGRQDCSRDNRHYKRNNCDWTALTMLFSDLANRLNPLGAPHVL